MQAVRTRDVALVAAGALGAAVVAGLPLGAFVPVLAVGACLLMHVVMMGHMAHRGPHGGGTTVGSRAATARRERWR